MKGKSFNQEGWADLECSLRERAGPEPTERLRSRVWDDVRRALSEPAQPPALRWTGAARWAAVAAVLIVGLALSQMAASITPFFDRQIPPSPGASVRAVAELMRQVSPGLTADEADRLALASASGGQLLAMPIANTDARLGQPAGGMNFHGDIR